MKKICSLLLVLALLSGCLLTVCAAELPSGETTAPTGNTPEPALPAVADGDASISNGCKTLDAAVPLGNAANILDTAKAAFLYELETDTVLYAANPDMQVYPASLVKLMTCLIAVENGNPDDVVVITQEMLDSLPWDAAVADFVAGEELTLRQLLYATMVSSANDAAVAVAVHIAGTQEAFVSMMNARAAELGCYNTNFTNAHGLHDDMQYTTARDLARIMREALKNEDFVAYFNEDYYVIEPTNKCSELRPLFTSNYLMSTLIAQEFYDDRVTGGKTGITSNDGWCLVSTAQEGNVSLLSIVLEAESQYAEDGYSVTVYGNLNDTAALIDYGFDYFTTAELIYENQSLTQYQVANGANDVVVGATESISAAIPAGVGLDELQRRFVLYDEQLKAPLEAGEAVGVVQIWYQSTCLAQCEMITLSPVALGSAANQDEQPDTSVQTDSDWGSVLMVFGTVFLVILGAVLLVFAVFAIRSAMIRARRRRRRKSRRRSR